jgi:putative serine protease PepD
MTTGYDPNIFEPGGGVRPGPSGAPADRPGPDDTAQHPGPMPPRIEPTWVTQPAVPSSTPPAPSSAPPAGGAYQPTPAQPVVPAAPTYQPGPGYPRAYQAPVPAYPPMAGATAGEPAPPAMPAQRRRLAWPGILALIGVLGLIGVVAFQARQIDRLNADLDRAAARVSEEQSGDDTRLDTLEGRAAELEKQAGRVFNPEAIATAVLPSVFRVAAGEFTGTAFAVGEPASGGGTNLFTNFHVVEAVWRGGDRQVQIERRGESYPARIVKVDEAGDVAQLTTTSKFAGLVTAPAAVKSGQQIVVVGAPLGLEDTVTTGVVSAFRELEDGSGTVIQFSAPINPGNSGGPVINGEKEVVGIATAKARDAEGIGLAVPIKTACDEFKIC